LEVSFDLEKKRVFPLHHEKGECTSIIATVTYQEGGLKQSNPYLLEDLNTIFHFFGKTMKPKPILELKKAGNQMRWSVLLKQNAANIKRPKT
jgi:hypothetical protein